MVVKVDGSWDNAKRVLEQCVMKVGGRKVVVRGDVYWEFMAADTLERRRWGNRRSLGKGLRGARVGRTPRWCRWETAGRRGKGC